MAAKRVPLGRRLVAESLGTFAITLVAMGVDVAYFSLGNVDYASRWIARGCVTAAVIYAFSEISGAHADPAVTFAFALRGVFPRGRCIGYVVAQCAGALFAAALVFSLYGSRAALGASHPGAAVSNLAAVAAEIVLTFLLVIVILATANQKAVVGREASLAVGLMVAAAGFIGGPISGASMNPARTLAPQLLAGQFGLMWIYVVGPLAGAALAVGAHTAIVGAPNREEREAAKAG